MEIIEPTEANLERAAGCIARGGLVAMPTETVYGLGGNAWDAKALARVFEAKARPHFDPLIVHVASIDAVSNVADLSALGDRGPIVRRLMEEFWPGPLTLILPKRPEVPDLATSGLPSVAVRFPAHPVARRLIELSTGAVAAPSANPFGYLSPTKASHVADQLGDKVDFIVDGGRCGIGVESTVLDVTTEPFTVLRPGGLPVESIRKICPETVVFDRTTHAPTSPGQLPSHYAPSCPLYLFERGAAACARPEGRTACLFFSRKDAETLTPRERDGFAGVFWLSETEDMTEAAANLFDVLHALDSGGYSAIYAEKLPRLGIGLAVNDRLFKASVK